MTNFYIGWDVGGWNCERNPKSRDSLAVLQEHDGRLAIAGRVSRGNIRDKINSTNEIHAIVNSVCDTDIRPEDKITMAIDTPLGFPIAIHNLLTQDQIAGEVPANYAQNPYLYRQTELWLFEKDFAPLSTIKDMIGSQATKGLHLLHKLGLKRTSCGVWTSGNVTAVETYPTPCAESRQLAAAFALLSGPFHTQDRMDAVYCALLARLFATNPSAVASPPPAIPTSEGWIWVPTDAIQNNNP